MSYDHPRDRLELLLKEIVDDSTPGTDRRTRFESFMNGIVTSGLTPAEARNRLELYLTELSGRAGGGSPPTGTINITTNGDHDVTNYATAHVAVPGITPTGTINITTNGSHDVTNYATAAVNVPQNASFPRSCVISFHIQAETDPGTFDVSYRKIDNGTVLWYSETVSYDEGTTDETVTVPLVAVDNNLGVLDDGIYIGPFHDSFDWTTDLNVTGGAKRYENSNGSNTKTIYITFDSTTATVDVVIP